MILKDLNIFIGKNDEQSLLDGYNGLNENKNNFSYWFPKIKDCGIEIPKTFYAKVPVEVYKDLLSSLDDNDLKLNNLQNFLSEDYKACLFILLMAISYTSSSSRIPMTIISICP